MTVLLIALLMTQLSAAPTGVATGIVLSPSGAPGVGVRVFAIPARDPSEAFSSPVVFESLGQTDASGRYRLEVPTGRYYIAVGSVNSPTYYPDATSISSAKQILITAGATVDEINFSRYVVASQQLPTAVNILQLTQPPGSTGLLSGVIRTSDGMPASGVTVVAVPLSTLFPGSTTFRESPSEALTRSNGISVAAANSLPASLLTMLRLVRGVTRAITDSTGLFRIENVPPDSYYILAGTADSPTYFPGRPNINLARTITTTPTTKLDTIDFSLAAPPKGIPIRGQVSGNTGEPAGNATVEMRSIDPALTDVTFLLPGRIKRTIIAGSDGSFEFADVLPGSYSFLTRLSGAPPVGENIVVAGQPVKLDFTIPVSVISARILWEDGSPVSLPLFSEIAASATSDPNLSVTSIFPASLSSGFSMVLDPGAYRFYVRDLPEGYAIRSIKAGSADLLKETLRIGRVASENPKNIEVRIAKTPETARIAGNVRGKVLDAATGRPPSASRLRICCFTTGPFERLSTAIGPDGSFEFSGVPIGRYTAELAVSPPVQILYPAIDVVDKGTSGLMLLSSPQFLPVRVNISLAGGSQPESQPEGTMVSVVLTSVPGSGAEEFQIKASGTVNSILIVSVPAGVRYNVTVSDLPAILKVKSIVTGTTDLMERPLTIAEPPPSPAGRFTSFYTAQMSLIPVQITLTPRE